jgi:hypothetical protein
MNRKSRVFESGMCAGFFALVSIVVCIAVFQNTGKPDVFCVALLAAGLGISSGYFIHRTIILHKEYKQLGDL